MKLDIKTGLTAEMVESRKLEGRENIAQNTMTKTTGQIVRENVFTLFNLMNLIIAIALFAVGAYSNMLFVAIIGLNVGIGIYQEIKAKKTVEKLSLLSAPQAMVLRDGKEQKVGVTEIVMDDLMVLRAGQQICCDALVVSGDAEVNEALLTGEADALTKTEGDSLLSGSSLISGKCLAQVVHVGDENYANKIAKEAKQIKEQSSELMQSMGKVTRVTSLFIIPLGLLLFVEAFLFRGDTAFSAVVASAAGLLGMLPKGLVLLISVSLAGGVVKLAKDKILIQDMFSLEALSHVDVLCLDKTGTLTEGHMKVEKVTGFSNSLSTSVDLKGIMGSFLKNSDDNNATFDALKDHFKTKDTHKALSKVPFSSDRKWSAVTFESGATCVIGAPERIVGDALPVELKREAAKGKRILIAGLTKAVVTKNTKLSEIEIIPVAGIILRDRIRKNAPKILNYFKKQGVTVKIISGDNPATVAAVSAEAGVPQADRAIDMQTVLEDADFKAIAHKYTVFGRTTPVQKKKLVQALKAQGHSVAMTGDGVNDLLALKEADCSIAMGGGSDAARQASQVVLLESDFSVLPKLLLEGRRVVNNVTRAAGVFFIKTIYSVLLTLVCVLTNMPFPFIPIQITLIDAVIEAYPAFLTAFEPDGRRIDGKFLQTALKRALPNAAGITVAFLLFSFLPSFGLAAAEKITVLYLLVGFVSIQAVFKNNMPFTKLRIFALTTTVCGYFTAILLFQKLLGLTFVLNAGAFLLLGLLMIGAFGVERFVTYFINASELNKTKRKRSGLLAARAEK